MGQVHIGGNGESDFLSGDPGKTPESFLTIQAHPVTRVYCTGQGIIAMERHGAEPIMLNSTSCKQSRLAALRRLNALLEPFFGNETDPRRKMAISDSGIGLTYNELRKQVYEACKKSKEIEAVQAQKAKEKRAKYKI